MSEPLLGRPLSVATAGLELFAAAAEAQGAPVERVAWAPPPAPGRDALERLALGSAPTAAANAVAIERMQAARPLLVGVARAADAIPGLEPNTILHAGPPVEWSDMAGPLRGAVIGALLHEGLAGDADGAARLAGSGAIEFAPCHERGAVGPMAGVTSATMPVWVVEDATGGGRAHCSLNEGLGRVLRYGAYDGEVLDRLRWMQAVLGPLLGRALERRPEPLDLRALIADAVQMGDECHNRNRAATSLLARALMPDLAEAGRTGSEMAEAARFIAGNDHFFLNLSMPAAKVMAEAAAGVPGSSVVTAMSRNGTEFGIRVSGAGERWFTGPAGMIEGLYFPGYGPDDACRDIGDSAITETVGLGGFAMAAAPAIASFVGGTPDDALAATAAMYDITCAESSSFLVPALGFRGTPTGIDCREVVHSGVLPVIDTGIAHREPGVGQIGAGIVRPPAEPFEAAVRCLAEEA